MTEELKPCAHCGWSAYVVNVSDSHGPDQYQVTCLGCGISTCSYADKTKAIYRWNTRATPPEQPTEQQPVAFMYETVHGEGAYFTKTRNETLSWNAHPNGEWIETPLYALLPKANRVTLATVAAYESGVEDGKRQAISSPPASDDALVEEMARKLYYEMNTPDFLKNNTWEDRLDETRRFYLRLAQALLPILHRERMAGAEAETYASWQQKRGMLADKVDWAINEYNEFMKDDAYDSQRVLDRIIAGLRETQLVLNPAAVVKEAGRG